MKLATGVSAPPAHSAASRPPASCHEEAPPAAVVPGRMQPISACSTVVHADAVVPEDVLQVMAAVA